jgi:hypothetical protein
VRIDKKSINKEYQQRVSKKSIKKEY